MTPSLLTMPNEILLIIASAPNLDFKSLNALTLTSRFLHCALNCILYKHELACYRRELAQCANVWVFPRDRPTAFDYAITHALEGTLDNLIRYGFNIEAPLNRQHLSADSLDFIIGGPVTPLFTAIVAGSNQAVQMLLRCGARVDVADAKGITALHVAAGWGQWRPIRDLIAAGAELEARTVEGLTPLWMAMDPGIWGGCDLRTMRELVAMGADVNTVNGDGVTLLHAAIEACIEDAVPTLLEAGADVRFVDKKGMQPLHHAVAQLDFQAIRALVRYGADVTATVTKGGVERTAAEMFRDELNLQRVQWGASQGYYRTQWPNSTLYESLDGVEEIKALLSPPVGPCGQLLLNGISLPTDH